MSAKRAPAPLPPSEPEPIARAAVQISRDLAHRFGMTPIARWSELGPRERQYAIEICRDLIDAGHIA